MGNSVVVPYDESYNNEYIKDDFYYAWMWLKHIAQNRNKFYIEPFLITNKAEELYEIHKNTEKFKNFVKYMGPIPI